MTRDPSDGSVREAHGRPKCRYCGLEDGACICAAGIYPASGLPLESTKAESKAKLEKSRAWLKDYHGSGE